MRSVLQEEKECFICGKQTGLHSHHIFPGSRRKKSEEHGLKVWLCMEHHTGDNDSVHMNPNNGYDLFLKQTAQQYYEEHIGTREQFREEFGKSYL